MQGHVQFLCRVYGLLLTFYPRRYKEEYGDELQAVFEMSLDEAATKGRFEVEKLVLRELISLPKAIIYEHLRERRKAKMTGSFSSHFDFAPGSRSEALAALAPFLLFGAFPTLLGYFRVMDFVPLWLNVLSVIVFWLFGLGLIVIGFIKRFPRWFMPYIGIPMPIISLLLFNILMEKWQGVWWYRLPWLLSDLLQQGLLWMGLVLLVILLLVATRIFPKSRPFYQRLRKDWTLLSFIIYGTMPFVLLIIYNEYKNVEPFMFLSLIILAAGGWLYLQSYESLKRFLYLYAGMELSMLVAAIGKAVLLEGSFPSGSWQTEFIDTLVTWLWLALIMLLPLAINLLPHVENRPRAI